MVVASVFRTQSAYIFCSNTAIYILYIHNNNNPHIRMNIVVYNIYINIHSISKYTGYYGIQYVDHELYYVIMKCVYAQVCLLTIEIGWKLFKKKMLENEIYPNHIEYTRLHTHTQTQKAKKKKKKEEKRSKYWNIISPQKAMSFQSFHMIVLCAVRCERRNGKWVVSVQKLICMTFYLLLSLPLLFFGLDLVKGNGILRILQWVYITKNCNIKICSPTNVRFGK